MDSTGEDFDLSTYVYRNARRWQDWIDAQDRTPEGRARWAEAQRLRQMREEQKPDRIDEWALLIAVFLFGLMVVVAVLFGVS